jgi:hypothetical protein
MNGTISKTNPIDLNLLFLFENDKSTSKSTKAALARKKKGS